MTWPTCERVNLQSVHQPFFVIISTLKNICGRVWRLELERTKCSVQFKLIVFFLYTITTKWIKFKQYEHRTLSICNYFSNPICFQNISKGIANSPTKFLSLNNSTNCVAVTLTYFVSATPNCLGAIPNFWLWGEYN